MPDSEAAQILDSRLRELERLYKRGFVERGFILLEMEERQLWKEITDKETKEKYTSFERWVCGAASHSRSDCFAALRAVKELRDVPAEKLLQTPRCNVEVLRKLSPQVRRRPEIIEAAQTKSEKEFIQQIEEKHPEQHIESKQPMNLKPVKSARKNIEKALTIAMWVYNLESREDAIEALATYFMQGRCEKEEYSQLSNTLAFETAKVHGKIPA